MVMKAAPAGRQRPQVVVVELLVSYYRYVNLILRMFTSLRRMMAKTIDDARKNIIQLAA